MKSFYKSGISSFFWKCPISVNRNRKFCNTSNTIFEETFHDFVKIDEGLICYDELTNEEIVSEIRNSEKTNSGYRTLEMEECGIIKNSVNQKEAATEIMTLTDFFKENDTDMKTLMLCLTNSLLWQ